MKSRSKQAHLAALAAAAAACRDASHTGGSQARRPVEAPRPPPKPAPRGRTIFKSSPMTASSGRAPGTAGEHDLHTYAEALGLVAW